MPGHMLSWQDPVMSLYSIPRAHLQGSTNLRNACGDEQRRAPAAAAIIFAAQFKALLGPGHQETLETSALAIYCVYTHAHVLV